MHTDHLQEINSDLIEFAVGDTEGGNGGRKQSEVVLGKLFVVGGGETFCYSTETSFLVDSAHKKSKLDVKA